jgi:MoxR-like ATPase
MTRQPAIIRSVRPNTDISAWFFSRSFNEKGTYWEEGPMLQALRDGYTTKSGRKIPYMVLISDFDRADRSQAEALRLVMDSIQGRIEGPKGDTHKVFDDTLIVATGNTAGGGDARGRCVSANVIDASILDRINRKFKFPWLDWKDEEEICKRKFPTLVAKLPNALKEIGKCVKSIRQEILNEGIYAEFSHRAVCAWLENAEDIIDITGKVPKNILKTAAQCWLDGMPDEENSLKCRKLMDPHLKGGALEEGDTDHIADGELVEDFS